LDGGRKNRRRGDGRRSAREGDREARDDPGDARGRGARRKRHTSQVRRARYEACRGEQVRGRQRGHRGHLGSLFWRFSPFGLLFPLLWSLSFCFLPFLFFSRRFGTFLTVRFRPFLFLQAVREEAAASKQKK
jgi:hypothetical protein